MWGQEEAGLWSPVIAGGGETFLALRILKGQFLGNRGPSSHMTWKVV